MIITVSKNQQMLRMLEIAASLVENYEHIDVRKIA
jgi:hypothetical protein